MNRPKEFNLRLKALLFPLVGILPLSAQTWEASLFAGQQQCRSGSAPSSPTGFPIRFESGITTAVGLRVGRSLANLGPAVLQATLGYQPSATSMVAVTEGNLAYQDKYRVSNTSVGAMFNFKGFVTLGAGLEYRFERLSIPGNPSNQQPNTSVDYDRPWIRANAGMDIPDTPCFLGLELAFPLISKGAGSGTSQADIVRSLAPNRQIGLYGGLRF